MAAEVVDLTTGVEQLVIENGIGKEVYETSDIEEEETEQILTTNNEDINQSNLRSFDESKTVFENTALSSYSTDFSGKLGSLLSYNSQYVKETRKQKLARIQRELLELQEDIETDNSKNNDEVNLNELSKLHREISDDYRKRIGDLKDSFGPVEGENTEEVTLPNITLNSSQLEEFVRLEKRIASLESRIGSTSGKAIGTMINELYRTINVLSMDTDSLNSFQAKLREISEEYECSIIGRRSQNDSNLSSSIEDKMKTTESKINDLYGKYNILNRYSNIIPQLTKRVESLQVLHSATNNIHLTVNDINQHLSSMDSQIDKWSSLLDLVSEKIETRENSLAIIKSEIETKIDTLECSVDKLKPCND